MAISTNRDYLLNQVSGFDLGSDEVDIILAKNPSINANGILDISTCDIALYKSARILHPKVESISEADFSKSGLTKSFLSWYKALCNELGKPNVLRSSIRNGSNMW